jgi:hypothetical protein
MPWCACLQLVMYEMSHGPVNFDSDRHSCLKLNPLSLDNYKGLSLSNNLDSDSNFFSDVFNCDFYTENTFNDIMLQDNFYNCENLS